MTSAALLQSTRNGNLQQEKSHSQNFQNGQTITTFRHFGTKWNPKGLFEGRNDIKKKSLSKNLTQNMKRQRIIQKPKTQDQKVNIHNNLYFLQRSCMRSLQHNYVY